MGALVLYGIYDTEKDRWFSKIIDGVTIKWTNSPAKQGLFKRRKELLDALAVLPETCEIRKFVLSAATGSIVDNADIN